jgi:suppressor of tumorigenicity protein 13
MSIVFRMTSRASNPASQDDDMGDMGGMGGLGGLFNDPEMMAAFADPEVAAAFKDISANPANIMKYQNNPKVFLACMVEQGID